MTHLFILAQAPGPGAGPRAGSGSCPCCSSWWSSTSSSWRRCASGSSELQQQVDQLQKGDKVVTNGGLHGEVAGIEGSLRACSRSPIR